MYSRAFKVFSSQPNPVVLQKPVTQVSRSRKTLLYPINFVVPIIKWCHQDFLIQTRMQSNRMSAANEKFFVPLCLDFNYNSLQ